MVVARFELDLQHARTFCDLMKLSTHGDVNDKLSTIEFGEKHITGCRCLANHTQKFPFS